MTELVTTEEIERITGVKRHPTLHFARRVSAQAGRIYLLHSTACVNFYSDLRDCEVAVALDNRAPRTPWPADETVAVALAGGWLVAVPMRWALDEEDDA